MVRMILLLVTTVVLISSSAARSDHALTMHREIKLSGEKLVKVRIQQGGHHWATEAEYERETRPDWLEGFQEHLGFEVHGEDPFQF